MQVLNCLIVEDEPLAASILEDYIRQIPGLILCASCDDVFSATNALNQHKVDVIFLDINLPKINGLEFLKSITTSYHIILTTAYHQYALDGFNLNVIDYLLKPIEFSRFLQAVNKVFVRAKPVSENPSNEKTTERKWHFFNVDKKQVKVFEDEILYIESLKDYIQIHTANNKLVTKISIGDCEHIFSAKQFVRIHKSFVVNVDKIKAYTSAEVELGVVCIPIGRSYKAHFELHIKTLV